MEIDTCTFVGNAEELCGGTSGKGGTCRNSNHGCQRQSAKRNKLEITLRQSRREEINRV